MARPKTTKNVYDQQKGKLVELIPSELKDVIGNATIGGCWLIYGAEKNGKTWFVLKLAKELARFAKVHYISAEEGLRDSFQESMRRANITTDDNIWWDQYIPLLSEDKTEDSLVLKLNKRRSSDIVVIDNLTMYADEIKKSELKKKLIDKFPNKLFIFVSHEERKQPYPAIAGYAKKLANVIFHIVGLKVFVVSRFGGGGELVINEDKSELYHGLNLNMEK